MMIDVSRHGPVTLITINNPPVNAMSPGVPGAIIEAVRASNADSDIIAIVLCGGGKGNIAGADIRFQGSKWPGKEPTLRDLIVVLEDSVSPIVAALGPNTLGGGLELAMACAYRVITPSGKVGQPEVNLGIPPGAGATQRLPRLAGGETALSMIVGGKPIGAEQALACGIVDEVIDGDLIVGAVKFAARLRGQHTRTRDRQLEPYQRKLFDQARARVREQQPNLMAPLVCIDCVEVAFTKPFDDGLAYERQRFNECVGSDQAAALRHVFFAERQAGKVADLDPAVLPLDVAKIAVVGAGTMGSGIAIALLKAGFDVTLIELKAAALTRGRDHIEKALQRDVEKGRLDLQAKQSMVKRLTPASELDAASDHQLVIEAVFEDMQVKQDIFLKLGVIAKDAVLATNTSYLDVNQIAEAAGEAKSSVVGMHFFSPANLMKLLEVVRGEHTGDQALLTALAVGKRAGKVAIVAGVCHGFIANRMYQSYLREANFLIEEGALPDQVDSALREFGFAMGPFAVSDLAGLDIGWANRKAQAENRDPSRRYSVVADRICERGWFGQKTARGFYRYKDGSRTPTVDPEITTLIESASADLGITRRAIDSSEIIERCVYAIVNEGAKILDEGIAERASDLDVAWIYGYGFPRWRGGPMLYASQVGYPEVLTRVQHFDEIHDFWTPAPGLVALAETGTGHRS